LIIVTLNITKFFKWKTTKTKARLIMIKCLLINNTALVLES